MAFQKSMIWSLALSKWHHGYSLNESSVTSNWWSLVLSTTRVRRPRADFFAITGKFHVSFFLNSWLFFMPVYFASYFASIKCNRGESRPLGLISNKCQLSNTICASILRNARMLVGRRRGHNLGVFFLFAFLRISAQVSYTWQSETTCCSHLLTP